jgi:hypothetical protein
MNIFHEHKRTLKYLGFGFFAELACIYLAVNVIYLFKLPFTPIVLMGLFLLTGWGVVEWLSRKGYSRKELSLYAGIVFISSILFSVAASYFIDVSFDGQTYDQLAVYALRHGYNPFYSPCTHANFYYVSVEHYVKCQWMLESFIYRICGRMEYAKGVNLIVLAASVFLVNEALQSSGKCLSSFQRWTATLIICFNPIVTSQLFTFLNDGILASFMICFLSLFWLAIMTREREYLFLMAITLVMMVNIKFTALVYALVFIAAGGVYLLLGKDRQLFYRLLKYSLPALGLATLFFSYNPYITNLRTHHNPVYPLLDKLGQGGIYYNTPGPLKDKSTIEKLYLSLASKVSDQKDDSPLVPLWPWQHQTDEFIEGIGSTRINGMGPYFPMALLLAHLAFLGGLIFSKGNRFVYLVCFLGLWGSILVNPEAWWMRYVPQLWIMACVFGIIGLSHEKLILKMLGAFTLAVLLVNLAFHAQQTAVYQLKANREIHAAITAMKNKTVLLENPYFFTSVIIRMRENKIPYQLVDKDHPLPAESLQYPYAVCRYILLPPSNP